MDGEIKFGEFKDLGDEADGAHGEVAIAEANFFVKDF